MSFEELMIRPGIRLPLPIVGPKGTFVVDEGFQAAIKDGLVVAPVRKPSSPLTEREKLLPNFDDWKSRFKS